MTSFRSWRSTMRLLLIVSTLCLAISPAAVFAQVATPAASPAAVTFAHPALGASAWLRAQQDASGGFPGYNGDLDAGVTTDAVMALYAVQVGDPDASIALDKAVTWLEENGASYAQTGAGQAAKLALAAVAGGENPDAFAGVDLFALMEAPSTATVEHPIEGIWGDSIYTHALVMMAFAAANQPIPDSAIEPLRGTQSVDGGWAFDGATGEGAADSNTTSMVIQALVAAGFGESEMIPTALGFLDTLKAADGGYAYGPGEPLASDANSTSLVLQALIATNQDSTGAQAALEGFQLPDGSLRYLPTDTEANLLATVQGVPALAGQPLPVAVACEGDASAGEGCVLLAA